MPRPFTRQMFAKRGMGVLLVAASLFVLPARAQDGKETDPVASLQSMLTAACRQEEDSFRNYLTQANAAAYGKLPVEERLAILKRVSRLEKPGRPLFSTDAQKHKVIACEGQGATTEFRFGDARVEDNLALIPVTVSDTTTQFTMVRENGGWRLLALGLLLFDVPGLEQQWADQELQAHEDAALKTLNALADAIAQYQQAFEQLPISLAQLGPASVEGVSQDAADLIASDLAEGSRDGYSFRYQVIPSLNGGEDRFELSATPEQYPKTGRLSFYRDGSGKMHVADKHGTPATAGDPLAASEN